MTRLKNVLFLGTRKLSIERKAEFDAARRTGFQVIVADSTEEGYEDLAPYEFLRVQCQSADKAALRITEDLALKGLSVHAVVPWSDPSVEVASGIVATLGLPGLSSRVARRVRDKGAVREALEKVPGANPRWATARRDEVLQAINLVGTPAVLKPPSASGSRGVVYVDDARDARAGVAQHLALCVGERDAVYREKEGTVLVEEKLTGSLHSVAGLVGREGNAIALGVSDKRVQGGLEFENCVPSCLDPSSVAAIVDLALQSVTAVGLHSCGFHVDVMLTAEGPRILEVGGRLGGECINSHLLPLATGLEPYRLLLSLLDGTCDLQHPRWNAFIERHKCTRWAVSRWILAPAPGRVPPMQGLDELSEDAYVHQVARVLDEGDTAVFPPEASGRYGVAIFIAACSLREDPVEVSDRIAAKVTPLSAASPASDVAVRER